MKGERTKRGEEVERSGEKGSWVSSEKRKAEGRGGRRE